MSSPERRGHAPPGSGAGDRRPGTAASLLLFVYCWVMVGFVTGTLVLLGPVRWATTAVRLAGWGDAVENWTVMGIIVLLVAGSLLLTRRLAGCMWRARTRRGRLAVPSLATTLAAAALWGWSNPGRMLAGVAGGETHDLTAASGAVFLFGPYPDRARLAELKEEGVSAVVSLQHPAVVPFEPRSITEERRNAAELGIRFIHAPMLPWISDNEAALATVRALARSRSGTFYVHCGLGRDRVNVARRAIEQAGARTVAARGLSRASRFEDRTEPFERGRLIRLEPEVWLIPYPNQAEFFGYVLAGQMVHVVSLLDTSDPEEAVMAAEGRRLLADAGVPLTEIPLDPDAGSGRIAAAVGRVRALPRPVAVIVRRTPFDEPHPGTRTAVAFAEAYRAAPAPSVGRSARGAEAGPRTP